MTSIVGIRCRDGVVIGADSACTFGDGKYVRTIEQETSHKIEIIGTHVIVAGTGYVGHGQRFVSVVQDMWNKGIFKNFASAIDGAKLLARNGVNDFAQTISAQHMNDIGYAAFVAFAASNQPCLCELSGRLGFQPEVKMPNDLWFTSSGCGQPITDPFLALLKQVFWHDGPPALQGGIFTAYWALKHACETNTGGIKEPIHIAVLERVKDKLLARMLSQDELTEHINLVTDAMNHMRGFRDIIEGKVCAEDPPRPPELR